MTPANVRPAQHVRVVYTGGTIGMQASGNGLAPASGFEERMRARLTENMPTWSFHEMVPLIDSANMTPTHWQRLRESVLQAVDIDGCDAVLILHGTDTLAYSAAALSFQLLGVPVPVVFTGSMLPAGVPDSDAWENLEGAFSGLSQGMEPGVHLHFHGEWLKPTRCAKVRSFGRHPFATLRRNQGAARADSIPAQLDLRRPRQLARIGILPLYPGFSAQPLQAILQSGIQALVLECFGSGTGPCDDAAFVQTLKQAQDNGIAVVAITQCQEGGVELDVYEAGSRMREVGVLSGGGMTREAAFGKLHALLGAGLPLAEVRRLMELDLCGELV